MSLVKKPAGLKKPVVKKPAMKPAVLVKPVEGEVKDLQDKAVVEESKEVVAEEPKEEVVEELAPIITPPEMDKEVVEVQEPVIEEIVEEKPKAKRKNSKKKKEEPKEESKEEEVVAVENLPQKQLNEALDDLETDINITEEGWEEAKQEIQDKLKVLTIDPDMNPATTRMLIGELDNVMTELRFLKTDLDTKVKALNEQIEYIRLSNSKGSNPEARKASGYEALMNHKRNPNDTEVINLVQVQVFMNGKLNFLNEAIETVKDKRQLLITFSSMLKIENTI